LTTSSRERVSHYNASHSNCIQTECGYYYSPKLSWYHCCYPFMERKATIVNN